MILPSILRRLEPALRALPPGRVLAAVSGGADSLALLRILREAGRDVYVAHINHQMRAGESQEDEAFVLRLCDELGVPCFARAVQVLGETNIEAQARALRYDALEEIAMEQSCACVATGHTASDNLETILLHWLRGATISGLRGVRASRPLKIGSQVLVVRPLLDVTRDECEGICREAGWEWRQDSSNQSPKYLRNRVRRELVPLLANLMDGGGLRCASRGASDRAARQSTRAAKLWADDVDLLDSLARAELQNITVRRAPGLLVLDGDKFRALHVALQRRVLRLGASEAEGADAAMSGFVGEISSTKIEEARLWIESRGARRVWPWRNSLRVEWCGAGSGNRIRLARVELGDNR